MNPTRFTQNIIAEYVRMGYCDYSLISDCWDRNASPRPDVIALVEEDSKITWAGAKNRWII